MLIFGQGTDDCILVMFQIPEGLRPLSSKDVIPACILYTYIYIICRWRFALSMFRVLLYFYVHSPWKRWRLWRHHKPLDAYLGWTRHGRWKIPISLKSMSDMESKILLLYLSLPFFFCPDATQLKCRMKGRLSGESYSRFIQKPFIKECTCVFGAVECNYLVLIKLIMTVNSGRVKWKAVPGWYQ